MREYEKVRRAACFFAAAKNRVMRARWGIRHARGYFQPRHTGMAGVYHHAAFQTHPMTRPLPDKRFA